MSRTLDTYNPPYLSSNDTTQNIPTYLNSLPTESQNQNTQGYIPGYLQPQQFSQANSWNGNQVNQLNNSQNPYSNRSSNSDNCPPPYLQAINYDWQYETPDQSYMTFIDENNNYQFTDDINEEKINKTEERDLDKKEKQESWYKNWIIEDEKDNDETENEHQDGCCIKMACKKHYGDVLNIISTYCKDWEDSPKDILTFFLCLAAFNKRTLQKEKRIYEENFILNAYHYAQFAFAAYKREKEIILDRLPCIPEESFIKGQWDKLELCAAPAWYCVIDHTRKEIILALRGTKEKNEIFIDLAAQFVKWGSGYVHNGFLKSLKKLEPLVKPTVFEQLNFYPNYEIKIVGHSMGAAVAALLVLKWKNEFPNLKIHGYGYATPCCVSPDLAKETLPYFTSFVHHFDAVSRLSMGSIQDLHQGMKMFVSRVKEKYKQLAILRTINFALHHHENEKILEIVGEINQFIQDNVEKCILNQPPTHLLPAGEIYQIWKEKRGGRFKSWEMYKYQNHHYARLLFAPTMLKDHSSIRYNSAFENMLSISIAERNIILSVPFSRRKVVCDYWNSFPDGNPFDDDYNIQPVIDNLDKISKYKCKAMKKGLIRPFLYLVSMSPKRRAAFAYSMGIYLCDKYWYNEFDSHRESWCILKTKKIGLQARSESARRK